MSYRRAVINLAILTTIVLAVLIGFAVYVFAACDDCTYTRLTYGNTGEPEITVYGVLNGSLYWSNTYLVSYVGHVVKTDLTTGVNTTIKTGDSLAAWQGVIIGDSIYAVGEEVNGSDSFNSILMRMNSSGIETVFNPDTDDCNEFHGVANNATHIVTGERLSGGTSTNSSYPNGAGVWLIPLATYNDYTTWVRTYEDPDGYEWRNVALLGSYWYAFLHDSFGSGAWKIIRSSDLTNWTTVVDQTGNVQATDHRGTMLKAGDNLVAFATADSEPFWYMYVYDGSWKRYNLGLPAEGQGRASGFYNSSSSKIVFSIGDFDIPRTHDLYRIDIDNAHPYTYCNNSSGYWEHINSELFEYATSNGVTYLPVSQLVTATTSAIYGFSPDTPEPSYATWWNESYGNRQKLTISANDSCANLSYYQIEFNVSAETGTSTGNTIYTNGSAQDDFDDVRFVDRWGVYQQDYWIETVTSGVNATFWVNFSLIEDVGTDYYIYYGNNSVGNISSGVDTFKMFDVNASGGLHNFWHFDEASYSGVAGEVIDECNDGEGVRYGDATTTTAGKFFNASTYDGTDDYILTNSSKPTLGTLGIALEFWENSSVTNPIGLYDSDPGTALTLRNYAAGIAEWQNDNPENAFTSDAGAWVHWIFIYYHGTDNMIAEYKNGALTDATTGASATDFAWNEFGFGGINKGATSDFTGQIDEFRVWEVDNIDDTSTLIEVASSGDYYMENMSSYFNFRQYSQCDPTTPYTVTFGGGEVLTVGCPSDLVITQLGGDEVQLNWTAGAYNNNFMVRMQTDSYPTSITDGQLVYYGSNNSTVDDGLSLDITTYYYRVWGENSGIYSDCYAENTIGGEYMLFLTYGLICLGLSGLAFWRRWTWVYMLAAIAWFGFGAYGLSGHTTGEIQWVFGWVGTAAGLVLIMAPLWNFYKDKREAEADRAARREEESGYSYDAELDEIYKGARRRRHGEA